LAPENQRNENHHDALAICSGLRQKSEYGYQSQTNERRNVRTPLLFVFAAIVLLCGISRVECTELYRVNAQTYRDLVLAQQAQSTRPYQNRSRFVQGVTGMRYPSAIDVTAFSCNTIKHSTRIRRACYDAKLDLLVLDIEGQQYAFCRVPLATVGDLVATKVTDAFYKKHIVGRYDCDPNSAKSSTAAHGKAPRKLAKRPVDANYGYCESGHWVQSVSGNGEVLQLEDGSLWSISIVDAITVSLWLPMSEIVACDDKLINTDDNEAVEAERIR
jgi:hypothetical protein